MPVEPQLLAKLIRRSLGLSILVLRTLSQSSAGSNATTVVWPRPYARGEPTTAHGPIHSVPSCSNRQKNHCSFWRLLVHMLLPEGPPALLSPRTVLSLCSLVATKDILRIIVALSLRSCHFDSIPSGCLLNLSESPALLRLGPMTSCRTA